MDNVVSRVATRAFNEPLLVHPQKAEAFLSAFGPRLTGTELTIVNSVGTVDHIAGQNPLAGIVSDRLGRRYDRNDDAPFEIFDGVAVIAVEGTLVQKGAYVGQSSGETSYEGLQVQIARAIQRRDVKGVVFEIDSYGGETRGAYDTADMIRALSRAKPTIAILTDFAYSAGYLMASQARQIVAPEFGGAGSIGVVMMHIDKSEALEKEGNKVRFIHAGKHKVEGNPFEPLPERIAIKLQSRVDQEYNRFVKTVGIGRGSRLTAKQARATEADWFIGSDALELGLIDAIGKPQEAFAAFIKEINRS